MAPRTARGVSGSMRQNILPILSPLGALFPTRRSIILGTRRSPSIALRLPRPMAHMNNPLSQADPTGICGWRRESSIIPTSPLNPNTFSI
jgi:hypothetical protein